jgi:hypothetical protein
MKVAQQENMMTGEILSTNVAQRGGAHVRGVYSTERLGAPLAVAVLLLAAQFAHAGDSGTGPQASSSLEIWKFWLSLVGYLGALGAFVVGLRQYRRADYWRRSEFLAKEMKEYFADAKVSLTLTMIDWGVRNLKLFEPFNSDNGSEETTVDRTLQCSALRPHTMLSPTGASDAVALPTSGGASFTPAEAAIRDCYDRFLDGLDRFGNYLSGDLVSVGDLDPYLGYWVRDIASTACDGDDALWCVCLFGYIEFYAFLGVQGLFECFGYDVSINGRLVETFIGQSSDQQKARVVIAHVRAAKAPLSSRARF